MRFACSSACGAIVALLMLPAVSSFGQEDFENPPISYSASAPHNCVSRLQQQLESGEKVLAYEPEHGYLSALLAELGVPVESQVLVFSKTSLQLRRISPRTPRAIYFHDDVYVGFCRQGDVLEISASDPELGTVFYTIDQQDSSRARIERHADSCLVCHSSSRTDGVPGHLVRSLYVDETGYPVLSGGSRNVNHTTPIEERWGGWYVTGQHGDQKHLGNLIVKERPGSKPVDNSAGQNVTSLTDRFDVTPYLSPHSDLIALMVLEHQALVHNRITSASFTARQALAYNEMMNEALKNPPETRLDSTTRRIQNAGDKLVEALLMADEAPLTSPMSGTSGFAESFAQEGPHDQKGRSLRELELQTRMFKYPCSYLIYSDSFTKLPGVMQDYVWKRLWDVLNGTGNTTKFSHLTSEDRSAILSILRETHPQVPASWTADTKVSQTDRL
ncbi:MAG: hypothetical protein ACK5Q5_10745 [Planctomycetaceae bacterium]